MGTIKKRKGIIFFGDEIEAADEEPVPEDHYFTPDGEMRQESLRKDLERCIEVNSSPKVRTVLGLHFGIHSSTLKEEFPEQCKNFPQFS